VAARVLICMNLIWTFPYKGILSIVPMACIC